MTGTTYAKPGRLFPQRSPGVGKAVRARAFRAGEAAGARGVGTAGIVNCRNYAAIRRSRKGRVSKRAEIARKVRSSSASFQASGRFMPL